MERRRQIRSMWENTQNNLSNIFISFHYCSFLLFCSFVICFHYSLTTNQCSCDVRIPRKFAVAHDPKVHWVIDWLRVDGTYFALTQIIEYPWRKTQFFRWWMNDEWQSVSFVSTSKHKNTSWKTAWWWQMLWRSEYIRSAVNKVFIE